MDREEAITWFHKRGVNAGKRDWSLGASIFIPASPPRDCGGIIGYDRVFYLYPWDGSWILLKLGDRQSETPYRDLESAAQAALDALRDSYQDKS